MSMRNNHRWLGYYFRQCRFRTVSNITESPMGLALVWTEGQEFTFILCSTSSCQCLLSPKAAEIFWKRILVSRGFAGHPNFMTAVDLISVSGLPLLHV